MYDHYQTSLSAPCGGLVYVFFGIFLKLWSSPKLEFEGSAQTLMLHLEPAGASLPVWGHSSQCSFHHWDLFGLHLQHLFQLVLQLLVLLRLFVLHLLDVNVSNCSLLLQVNHSQRLLADGQLTSQVVSMFLYALGVIMTRKRPTHESKFHISTVLEEIL